MSEQFGFAVDALEGVTRTYGFTMQIPIWALPVSGSRDRKLAMSEDRRSASGEHEGSSSGRPPGGDAGRDARPAPVEGAGAAPTGPLPAITLPKGGGAIRGMGEKFAANPVTGTGSLTVPIPTSPGRSGFGPELSLSYDSGSGNGPFGFGWSLSIPSITRKTDQGLPRYIDADESDVYILSGSEDLVPVLEADGRRYVDEASAPGFTERFHNGTGVPYRNALSQ